MFILNNLVNLVRKLTSHPILAHHKKTPSFPQEHYKEFSKCSRPKRDGSEILRM
jgi:hypothetical protein